MTMENVKTDTKTAPFKIATNTWGEKKTKLKTAYSQLNDADLHFVEGKESELTGRLTTKLHKSEVEVQKIINEI
jgi:ribosomal protein L30E